MSGRKRSRSRSLSHDRDRSRSSSRRHRKKHKRRRSRSSSNVHVNPFFAAGPSVYNQEQEIIQLRNDLYVSQTRANALESETNRLRLEIITLREELNRSKVLNEHKLRDSQMKTSNIERTNSQLRAQCNAQGVELQKLNEKVKFHDIEQAANKERVIEIEKRNQTIVAKCEELSTRSRSLQLEKDQAEHAMCVVKQQLNDVKQTIQQKDETISGLQSHINFMKEGNTKLLEETLELEKKLKEKDLLIIAEKRKFAQEKRKDQELIGTLEEKLKTECQQIDIEHQLQIILGTFMAIREQQDVQIDELKKRIVQAENKEQT